MKNQFFKISLLQIMFLLVFSNLSISYNINYENSLDLDYEIDVNVIPSSEFKTVFGKTSNKTVFGFLPYWVAENLNLEPLTHVAWFGIELNSDGTVDSSHGWPETELVSEVHFEGKKIVLVASMFDDSSIQTMLSNLIFVNTTVNTLLTQVQNGNADGICIDFEFPPSAVKTELVNFMNQLNSTFKAANSSYHVSLSIPHVDWNGAFDLDQIAPHVDSFIMMGYGYYYSGSPNAGPTSPLYGGTYNLNRSVQEHITWGAPAEKLILSLPFYGRDYPVVDETKNSATRGTGSAITYNDSIAKKESDGSISLNYDPTFECEWYNYYEFGDGWHQVWCETIESLLAKMDYIIDESLGGLGIWAWGYQGGHEELEDMIYYKFHEDTTPPTVSITDPNDGASFNSALVKLEWQGSDNIGIKHYSISWNNEETWEIMNLKTTKSINLTDGSYNVIIRITDTNDNSAIDSISFYVATSSPLLDYAQILIIIGSLVGIETALFILRKIKKKRK